MHAILYHLQGEEFMKRFSYAALIPLIVISLYCKKETKVQREGVVNLLTGAVTVIDGEKKSAARVGDVVRQGMIIETADNSFADIYFDDSAVKILENSVVEISELELNIREESEKTRFHVTKGKVFAKVARKLSKKDRFVVTTPTATAGVRGTEFLVAEELNKGLVATLNGTVAVTNEVSADKQVIDVTGGKEVVIEMDKLMTLQDLSAENRMLLEGITRNFQDAKKEIRERFEKKREEIRKAVEDQRQKNLDSIEKQKSIDLQNVEEQKALDKANVEKLKINAEKTADQAKESVSRQQEEAEQKLESVKPDIKKFKGTLE